MRLVVVVVDVSATPAGMFEAPMNSGAQSNMRMNASFDLFIFVVPLAVGLNYASRLGARGRFG